MNMLKYIGIVLLLSLGICSSYAKPKFDDKKNNVVHHTQVILKKLPHFRGESTLYDSRIKGGARFMASDDGRLRIGLLLPKTADDENIRNIAKDLFNVAQLALFDVNKPRITLIIKDTKGTKQGAIRATKEVILEGVELIIGPLFGHLAKVIAPIAKKSDIPILTFSNNYEMASSGVWILGFAPEQNLDRIIREACIHAFKRFVALIPETDYGRRLERALPDIIEKYGGELVQIEHYKSSLDDMFEPVQRIAQYELRKMAWHEEKERLLEEAMILFPDLSLEALPHAIAADAPDIQMQLDDLSHRETFGEMPFDAVLIPEGGMKLRSLAPLLPYYDIDPRKVKFLGTGLWVDTRLQQEPPLIRGWYAAPNPEGWKRFSKRFEDIYGYTPHRISTLSYDAISLIAKLIDVHSKNPLSFKNITNPNGFMGIDGVFRLNPDGSNDRGLSVMEVHHKSNRIISPSPQNFIVFDQLNQRNVR